MKNKFKPIRLLILDLIIVGTFLILPVMVNAQATDVTIEGIKNMKIGESQELKATVKKDDDDTNDYKIIYQSENEQIATVDETGKITAISNGTTSIIVKIENTAIQKKFEINVIEEQIIAPVVSNDATLKSLSIKGYDLDKTFNPNETDYKVTIPSTIKSLTINKEANHTKASIQVSGNSSLKNGDIIKIIVTAEDKKTTKTYHIKVLNDEINLNLKSLKILGQSLNETFKATQTKYTLTVAYEIEVLNIEAKAESEDAKVEISGNDKLYVGINTITITVKSKTSSDKKTYTVTVTREKETEQTKPTPTPSTSTETPSSKPTTKPTTSKSNSNFAKYMLVTIGCLVLFAIGGVGIYFYIKTAEPKKDKKSKNNQSKNIKSNEVIIEKQSKEDDLENTKEFKKEELIKPTTSTTNKYDDVLKDIEDLFED